MDAKTREITDKRDGREEKKKEEKASWSLFVSVQAERCRMYTYTSTSYVNVYLYVHTGRLKFSIRMGVHERALSF
jgi:hypothetical protein